MHFSVYKFPGSIRIICSWLDIKPFVNLYFTRTDAHSKYSFISTDSLVILYVPIHLLFDLNMLQSVAA